MRSRLLSIIQLLLAEQFGWQMALWLVAFLGLISWLGLLIRLPAISAGPAMPISRKLALLGDRNVMTILLVSLLAAVASLGMYTFMVPLMADPAYGGVNNITPYLWVWGLGGVAGSFLVGPLADRIRGPMLTFLILVILSVSLFALPAAAAVTPWLAMMPIAVWGAVGWALQVPQNNELIAAREHKGDGNLAVALNESALYLGSAMGAAAGGFVLLLQMPGWTLAISAGVVSVVAALLQLLHLRNRKNYVATGATSVGADILGAHIPLLTRR